jgi:hypothetical protein
MIARICPLAARQERRFLAPVKDFKRPMPILARKKTPSLNGVIKA